MSPGWERRFLKHSEFITEFYRAAFSRAICPDGEPQLLSPLVEAAGPRAQSVYAELLQSEGVSEAMQTVVLRQARRLAVFGANRQKDTGALQEDERTIMRLLVPHIRRAVTISDILDMKKLEAHALAATLDSCAIGVIVVADRRRIMYANHAARRMFSVGGPVLGADGFLKARDSAANRQLTEAIAWAQRNETMIGATGIGIPLRNQIGEAAIAHVLPLADGNLRTRLMPQATAAVFVTEAEGPPIVDIDAVAASFSPTPAEARTLRHLVGGATVMETADALGISVNTTQNTLGSHFFQDRRFSPSRLDRPRASPDATDTSAKRPLTDVLVDARGDVDDPRRAAAQGVAPASHHADSARRRREGAACARRMVRVPPAHHPIA